ncbi:hypothetical protein MRX96_054616 [Rhipicephalus microplus]
MFPRPLEMLASLVKKREQRHTQDMIDAQERSVERKYADRRSPSDDSETPRRSDHRYLASDVVVVVSARQQTSSVTRRIVAQGAPPPRCTVVITLARVSGQSGARQRLRPKPRRGDDRLGVARRGATVFDRETHLGSECRGDTTVALRMTPRVSPCLSTVSLVLVTSPSPL